MKSDNPAASHRERPRPWTEEEDQLLLQIVNGTDRRDWTTVASQLEGRTGKQCRQRFSYHLEQEYKKGGWTAEEDRTILRMQAEIGNSWSKIAKLLPGRNDNSVKNRWYCALFRHAENNTGGTSTKHRNHSVIASNRTSALNKPQSQKKIKSCTYVKVKPARRKVRTAPWSIEEDQALLEVVRNSARRDWPTIAVHLNSCRTGKQCRQRYNHHLQEEYKVGGWTAEEDETILQEQAKHGNCWARISRLLPGRSDNAVKNRWYCTLQQRQASSSHTPPPRDGLKATINWWGLDAADEDDEYQSGHAVSSPEPFCEDDASQYRNSRTPDTPPQTRMECGEEPTPMMDGQGPFAADCAFEPFALPEEGGDDDPAHGLRQSRLKRKWRLGEAETATPPPQRAMSRDLRHGGGKRLRVAADEGGGGGGGGGGEAAPRIAGGSPAIRLWSTAAAGLDGSSPPAAGGLGSPPRERASDVDAEPAMTTPSSPERHARHFLLLRRLLACPAAGCFGLAGPALAGCPRDVPCCALARGGLPAPPLRKLPKVERDRDTSPPPPAAAAAAAAASETTAAGGEWILDASVVTTPGAWPGWPVEEGCLADAVGVEESEEELVGGGGRRDALGRGAEGAAPKVVERDGAGTEGGEAESELLLSFPAQFLATEAWRPAQLLAGGAAEAAAGAMAAAGATGI